MLLKIKCQVYHSEQSRRNEIFFYEVAEKETCEGEHDDDEVEDVPGFDEVVLPEGEDLHTHLGREDHDEEQVGVVQDESPFRSLVEVVAHHAQLLNEIQKVTFLSFQI